MFKQTGGIAGEETSFNISEDGKYTFKLQISGKLRHDKSGILEPTLLKKLISFIKEKEQDIISLKKEYRAVITMKDGYEYTLQIALGDIKADITATTEGNAPDSLHKVIKLLEEIMKEIIR